MTSSDSSIPDNTEGSPTSRNWRKEKACFLCEAPLGHGLLRSKKHGCKFCLHAVCSDCSPNRKVNKRTGKEQRICTSCEEIEKPNEQALRRAATSLDILTETEEKLKLETALRQSVECKYAVAAASVGKKSEELEEVLKRAEMAEKKVEEVTNQLESKGEQMKEMEAFIREIAAITLGRSVNTDEIDEETSREVLRKLTALLSVSQHKQLSKSQQIITCESHQIASIKPYKRAESPRQRAKPTCETIKVASIAAKPSRLIQLSFDSASLSLPALLPTTYPDDITQVLRKSDPSTTVRSHFHEEQSCSSAPESTSPCLRCEELTAELSKLRVMLTQLPRRSVVASKGKDPHSSKSQEAPVTQSCQCVIT